MVNIIEWKEKLVEKGFYDIISSRCYTSDKLYDCQNREDNIKIGKIKDTKFITITTPCRIGRDINCMIKKSSDCSPGIKCPLCYFTQRKLDTICSAINKIELYDLEHGFIMIPNAFPYLENHFLITVDEHKTQFEILNNSSIELLNNIKFLLSNNPNAVIFFNGMCGNSLEHFHCQITTTQFPIFSHVPSNDGLIDTNGFRGWFINFHYTDDTKFNDMIKKLEHQSYNFIINLKDDIYQCIFFIRNNCEKVVPNLNFGSTELAGIIGSNKDDFPTKDDIEKYLEETNNLSNYNFLDKGAIKKRRNKRKKSKKGKSKRKSKKDQNKKEKNKKKKSKKGKRKSKKGKSKRKYEKEKSRIEEQLEFSRWP